MVCELGNAGWRGGEVRMQMADRLASQQIRKVSSLEKGAEITPSGMTQCSKQSSYIAPGMSANSREIASNGPLAEPGQREVRNLRTYKSCVTMHRLVARIFEREYL